MDDLSITIVSYKNYKMIEEAVDSIEKYTDNLIKKKIFIVDNAANLCTEAEKEEFINHLKVYNDVEYIDTKKNLGFGKGHNFVIDKLNSRYHAIVNPDILLKEDSFKAILGYLDNNMDVGMCVPRLVDINGKLQNVYRINPTIFDMFIRFFCSKMFPKKMAKCTMQNEDYSKPFQVPFAQGSFLVIKTELFKKINGFDDNYFMYLEDADLCRQINKISKVMYIPYTEVIHKWEKGSHKNLRLFMYHVNSMKYYFKKWKK